MFTKISVFLATLALILSSGALAYDHGTKATAMQNIANDTDVASQVVESSGPIAKHYDKASVASLNLEADRRSSERAFTTREMVPSEMTALRTQRGDAADVSFPRTTMTTRNTGTTEYSAPRRNRGGEKPAYWATHND